MVRDVLLSQQGTDIRRTKFLAPVGMLHAEGPWFSEHGMVSPECGSEGAAGIPRRGLNEEFVEAGFAKNARIGNAIESYAACHAEFFQASFSLEVLRHPHQEVFGNALNAGSNI